MPVRNRTEVGGSDTVDLTRRYLSELGSYPLLTAEDEVGVSGAGTAPSTINAESFAHPSAAPLASRMKVMP